MVLKTDKEKVKTLLSETIRLLCKNGLHFKSEFSVEALVGITLDKDEEFFLSIKEIVKNDIPPPKPEPKPRESRRSSIRQDVKGEPGDFRSEESPSATPTRKRPAESMDGNGDLPSLSLGDMQEGSSQFWPSVPTPAPDDDPGGDTQTPKKKRPEPNEDDSNSNVITIKGEPGSDSDDDVTYVEGNDQESNMGDNSMGDMSSSFMYGTPVSAEQTMLGNVPPGQIPWEQMQQFPMPGPSGMPTGPDGNHDNSQQAAVSPDSPAESTESMVNLDTTTQAELASRRILSAAQAELASRQIMPAKKMSVNKLQRLLVLQKDPYYIPRLMRRILLTKGREVTPKQVYWNFSYRDRPSVALIHQVMKELASKGLGQYGKNERKTFFTKGEPWTVGGMLPSFGVDGSKYEKQFYAMDNPPGPSGFSPPTPVTTSSTPLLQ